MRLPHLQKYLGMDMDGLPYEGKVRTIKEKGLRCVLRSTEVSGGKITDGIVVFDGGVPVAAYFEEGGEGYFGRDAMERLEKLSGMEKAVTDVFTLSPIQLRMIRRADERAILKREVPPPAPSPGPSSPPRKSEVVQPLAVPPERLERERPVDKVAEVISKIDDISRRAKGTDEVPKVAEAPRKEELPVEREVVTPEIPPPQEIKEPDTFSLIEVPPGLIQEKAMEMIVEGRGGKKLTEREMAEFGEMIFGTKLEWHGGITRDLMKKYGISREALLKSYRLSDPSANQIDRIMAEFYDVDTEEYSDFKKEISDGIVKEASKVPGVTGVTCLVNFIYDEKLKSNYPELLIEATFSKDAMDGMDEVTREMTREKIGKVAEGILERSLSSRKVDVSPEKKKVSVEFKEEGPPERLEGPSVNFIKKVEAKLSEVFNEAMVNHIISWHLDALNASRETLDKDTAHEFLMKIIPDITAQGGIVEGLRVGQEIKNILKKEFR
jgi:hypothetical protein